MHKPSFSGCVCARRETHYNVCGESSLIKRKSSYPHYYIAALSIHFYTRLNIYSPASSRRLDLGHNPKRPSVTSIQIYTPTFFSVCRFINPFCIFILDLDGFMCFLFYLLWLGLSCMLLVDGEDESVIFFTQVHLRLMVLLTFNLPRHG